MQLNVLKHVHKKRHFGYKRCEGLLNKEFSIPNMQSKFFKNIAICVTCLLYHRKHGKKESKLHPLPK